MPRKLLNAAADLISAQRRLSGLTMGRHPEEGEVTISEDCSVAKCAAIVPSDTGSSNVPLCGSASAVGGVRIVSGDVLLPRRLMPRTSR